MLTGKKLFISTLALLSLGFWALSLLMFLHDREILILYWTKTPIQNFRHESGNAWFAKFTDISLTSPSRAMLMENGRPLGRGNVFTDSIAYFGEGRYYVSGNELLFSTSDNSNPAENGRKYELLCAGHIPRSNIRWNLYLALLTTVLTAALGYGHVRSILRVIRHYVLSNRKVVEATAAVVSFTMPVVVFLITRLPYFLYYPVVLIRPDSYGYFDVAAQISMGNWPDLSLRTPGYPMFIAAVFLFSKETVSVIFMQNLLSLAAVLTFIYGIFVSFRSVTPLAALAMSAFISSHVQMAGDISLLSESVFVSAAVFAFAFLVIALKRRQGVFFALASVAFAFAVYVRPAGVFVAAIVVLVILYLWINGYGRRMAAFFAAPFFMMLLVLCSYNYITLKSFALDNHSGEVAVILNEVFLERDVKYPERLNAAIGKIYGYATPEERAFLNSTWDMKKYNDTMNRIYGRGGGDAGVIGPISEALESPPASELKKVLRVLFFDAVKWHRFEFMKKCFIFMSIYFENCGGDTDIYRSINSSYSSNLADSDSGTANALTRLSRPMPYFTVQTLDRGGLTAHVADYRETGLQWFHYLVYTKFHRAVFRGLFWPAAFFVAFVVSAVCLIRGRFKNTGAFVLFLIGCSVILHAVGVSVTAFPNPRYSYTMEFAYYVLPLMLAICKSDESGSCNRQDDGKS